MILTGKHHQNRAGGKPYNAPKLTNTQTNILSLVLKVISTPKHKRKRNRLWKAVISCNVFQVWCRGWRLRKRAKLETHCSLALPYRAYFVSLSCFEVLVTYSTRDSKYFSLFLCIIRSPTCSISCAIILWEPVISHCLFMWIPIKTLYKSNYRKVYYCLRSRSFIHIVHYMHVRKDFIENESRSN